MHYSSWSEFTCLGYPHWQFWDIRVVGDGKSFYPVYLSVSASRKIIGTIDMIWGEEGLVGLVMEFTVATTKLISTLTRLWSQVCEHSERVLFSECV